MKKIHKKAFSLIEIILSLAILTTIVYSVFIIFDRTMQALDDVFVGTHQYEEVRRFFEQISKELVSSVVLQDADSYFSGGPHWIEFTTPVMDTIDDQDDIENYIQTGANQQIADYTKVHYYNSRPIEPLKNYKDFPHELVRHKLYRIIPKDNKHENIFTYLKKTGDDSFAAEKYSKTNLITPTWLDIEKYSENIDIDSSALNNYLRSIQKTITNRGLRFRYYYEVQTNETPSKTVLYYQDWWDSRLEYPSFANPDNKTPQITSVYTRDYYKKIDIERQRRYGETSFDEFDVYPDNAKRTFGDFLEINEFWQYEPDTYDSNKPYSFLCFSSNEIFGTKNDPVTMDDKKFLPEINIEYAKIENIYDPWFQKPPSIVEITVYLFDKTKKVDDLDDMINTPEIAYKGEVFTTKIYMRTKSDSIVNFYRDLVIE